MDALVSKMNFFSPCKQGLPCDSSRFYVKTVHCTPIQQEVEAATICDSCRGRGWLICDFCRGQKTNVKADNNKVYRRCPSCKAIGNVLCSKCKVFRCITFPDDSDGVELKF